MGLGLSIPSVITSTPPGIFHLKVDLLRRSLHAA
jgi:hypothetical protein